VESASTSSLRRKVLVLSIVPLIAICMFAAILIINSYKQYKKAESLERSIYLSTKISAVIHELQKERGRTAGFLGSGGREFKRELQEQRILTDKKIADLEDFVGKTYLASLPEKSRDLIKNVISSDLNSIIEVRNKVDKLIIGGGMAFTFLKALGYEVGNSLVEDDLLDDAKEIMEKAKENGVKFYLPVDVVVADKFEPTAVSKYLPIQEIPKDWMGLDVGPATNRLFREAINDAQTILWNGPMGVYEMDKFSKGSFMMSHYVADSHATTIIGGGDTGDVVSRAGDIEEMTFISTGGGASLELLEGKVLPGVEAVAVSKASL